MRMSQKTTSEILQEGNYLLPTFDPESLTIAQLTGVLQADNVRVPTKCRKSDLIDLFNKKYRVNTEAVGASTEAVGTGPSAQSDTDKGESAWEDNNVFQLGAMLGVSRNFGPVIRECERSNVPHSSAVHAPPSRKGPKTSTRTSFSKVLSESPQTSLEPPTYNSSGHWLNLLPNRANIHRTKQRPTIRTLIIGSLQDFISALRQSLFIFLIFAFIGSLFLYQLRPTPIGYCDRGSQSNEILAEIIKKQVNIKACYEQQAIQEEITCPSSSVLFHHEKCTPCPGHASCHLEDVVCDDGYVLERHPLSFVPILSKICDGLPLLGPVAFPSKCIEDPMRKKSIGALGEGITLVLATQRGRKICMNEIQEKSFEGGEAQKWGLEIKRLKSEMERKQAPSPMTDHDDFNILFGEAVQQLLDYGHVIKGHDSEGQFFLATEHADMSWNCRILAFVRNTWKEWCNFIIGVLVLIVSAIYGQYQISAKRRENIRVSELVQLALNTLRNQEFSHHSDPITTPVPYVSSLQLRDSILEEEHSIAVRIRLWGKVENIIEGNANVRVNMEELPQGDELRVWRWVGGAIVGRSDIGERRK